MSISVPRRGAVTEEHDFVEYGFTLVDDDHPELVLGHYRHPPFSEHRPDKTMFGEHRIKEIVQRRVTATVTVTEWERSPDEVQPQGDGEVW